MINNYYFPFGKQLQKVEQQDKTPKEFFVLGVYASAVHACWRDNKGKQKIAALAVSSEPEIFWTGENADEIIRKIEIPEELGTLMVPRDSKLNGPSGRALDELFLKPLGQSRKSTWLCDLLPYSRVNENQKRAIENHYTKEVVEKFKLNHATIPDFDKSELNSSDRRLEILKELELSKAETIVLLGDLPIYWFLRFFDKKYSKLSQFGEDIGTYGKVHEIKINSCIYKIIPLCHPRQAARLGSSSNKWGLLHDNWIKNKATKR